MSCTQPALMSPSSSLRSLVNVTVPSVHVEVLLCAGSGTTSAQRASNRSAGTPAAGLGITETVSMLLHKRA